MTQLMPVMAPPVTVTVDGREVEVPRGSMMLEAVLAAGVDLPHLCRRRRGRRWAPAAPG